MCNDNDNNDDNNGNGATGNEVDDDGDIAMDGINDGKRNSATMTMTMMAVQWDANNKDDVE